MDNTEEIMIKIVKASNDLVTSVLDVVMKSAIEFSTIDVNGERQVSVLNLIGVIESAKTTINKRDNG